MNRPKCSVSGCNNIPSSSPSVCEYHRVLSQQKREEAEHREESVFADRLKAVDDGRFSGVLNGLRINDYCLNCYYLNPTISNPGQGYRCFASGSCIAATLSSGVLSYLFWKLDIITEEQHIANIQAKTFLKV